MAALKMERSMFEEMPYDGIVGLGLGGWERGKTHLVKVGWGMVTSKSKVLFDIAPSK